MAEKRTDDGRLAENASRHSPVKEEASNSDHELDSDVVEGPEWKGNDGRKYVLSLLVKYRKVQEKKIVKEVKSIPYIWKCAAYWNFCTQRKQGQNMLDDIVKNHGCSVTVCNDDKDLYIFEVTGTTFQQESDFLNFLNDVLDNIYKCAKQSLCFDVFAVDHRIQEATLQRVIKKEELKCAWIELVGEHDPDAVYVVCAVKDKMSVFDVLTSIISEAKECYNNHEEIVVVDFIWQRVLNIFEYLQECNDKFPNIMIKPDEAKDAVMLKGPRDESKAAADHLLELLGTARSEVHEKVFSPVCQFEIFTYPEMCEYIDNSIPELPIVWIPNNLKKTIHIFSKQPEKAKGTDKSIKGCIQERLYPLLKCHSLLQPGVWSLEKLKKKHKGKLLIQASDAGLIVTTADDIFETVDAEIQEIISRKRETNTPMGKTAQEESDPQSNKDNNCPICFGTLASPIKLLCGHGFHGECIIQSLKRKKTCPVCKTIVGVLTGNQPTGIMYHNIRKNICLPGYSKCGTIEIFYDFPDGIQGQDQSHPGKPYQGNQKRAFLPDSKEGQKVYKLLTVAFDRKLTFAIAESRRTGKTEYIVTWNGIHHKTKSDGGPSNNGYPDDTYLTTLQEQLKDRGVTEKDISGKKSLTKRAH